MSAGPAEPIAPSEVTRLPTPLVREEILGIVWAAAGPLRVPARPWPLHIALDVVEVEAPPAGRLWRALECWPASVTSRGRYRIGMEQMLRQLAREGALSVEGLGWDAGYRPTLGWLQQGTIALASLTRAEHAAVRNAAQKLVASLTTWSKKSRTDLSERSLTS
jgi:hypothetical protein